MESHSGQKWSRLFLRVTSPDVIPSSEMQIHPFRIDIDLSRFVLVGREIFRPIEYFFTGREFFLSVENFLTGREYFSPVEELFCRSRIFGRSRIILPVENCFWSVENSFHRSRIVLPVENSFCWSKGFLPIEDGEIFVGSSRLRSKTYHVV